jgi:3-methyladenine DNA glycosylase AlkD
VLLHSTYTTNVSLSLSKTPRLAKALRQALRDIAVKTINQKHDVSLSLSKTLSNNTIRFIDKTLRQALRDIAAKTINQKHDVSLS